jgi:hypothetical protein
MLQHDELSPQDISFALYLGPSENEWGLNNEEFDFFLVAFEKRKQKKKKKKN